MLQIMTRKYPVPDRAMNRVRDTSYPIGWANIPVPELKRRHSHLRLVAKTHSMLCLAKDCLKDMDTERPSGQQICQRLLALKESPQYVQSLVGRGGEREGGERVEEGGRGEGGRSPRGGRAYSTTEGREPGEGEGGLGERERGRKYSRGGTSEGRRE